MVDIRSFFKKPSGPAQKKAKPADSAGSAALPGKSVSHSSSAPKEAAPKKSPKRAAPKGKESASPVKRKAAKGANQPQKKRKALVLDEDEEAEDEYIPDASAVAAFEDEDEFIEEAKPAKKKSAAKSTPVKKESSADDQQPAKKRAWNPNQVRPEPPMKGQKEAPSGSTTCLSGMSFVVTGVLDSLEREECEDLIKRHGGLVRGGVSGKTSFLVYGTDAGQSKLDKAEKHGTKKIDEDGLFKLIVERSKGVPNESKTVAAESKVKAEKKPEAKPVVTKDAPAPVKRVWNPNAPRPEPPMKGQKEAPVGSPSALSGLAFVVTGILDSLEREECEDLIKRHGGLIRSAVSGKTSFLVVGAEPGASKITKAEKFGTPQIDEDGLFKLIIDKSEKTGMKSEASSETKAVKAEKKSTVNGSVAGSVASNSVNSSTTTTKDKGKAPAAATKKVDARPALWTEQFRPQKPDEVLGHTGHVRMLIEWMQNWRDRFGPHGTSGSSSRGGGGSRADQLLEDLSSKRAVLVSGPPGIGKTSAVHVAIRAAGFDVREFNASDTRSKATLQSVVDAVVGSHSLSGFDASSGSYHRMVLVMDEVDGMSRGDRGGVGELCALIRKSKIPIVCICNDRYAPKLRPLLNVCADMKFARPNKQTVVKRLQQVMEREGVSIGAPALEMLVESLNNDIRLCLNNLYLWTRTSSDLGYDAVKKKLQVESFKNEALGPMPLMDRFFLSWGQRSSTGSTYTLPDLMEFAFSDSELIPLFVNENYIRVNPSASANDLDRLDRYADAAELMSRADTMKNVIGSTQDWSLMPQYLLHSCVLPSRLVLGRREPLHPYDRFWAFPQMLGKISSTGKNRRLASAVRLEMASGEARVTGTVQEVLTEYVPLIRKQIMKILRDKGADGIDDVIALMDQYHCTREDIEWLIDVTKYSTVKESTEEWKSIPAQVKSKFTRAYNQAHKQVSMLKADKKAKGVSSEEVAVEEADEEMTDHEDEDENDVSEFVKKGKGATKGKKAAGRGRGKATRGRGRGRGRGK